MTHFQLQAYGAGRVVVAVENAHLHRKIFQINFMSKDGSLFVSVPYAKLGIGRLGIANCPAGSPESLIFGESAPVTSHAVKYAHHLDGEAHFSQDGKIFTHIRRKAVPLVAAGGHLFTVMVQGLHRFDEVTHKDIATPARGIVSMPVREGEIEALKFVARLYSSMDLAKLLKRPKMESAWLPLESPDGRRLVGIVLATKIVQAGQSHLLLVSVEEVQRIAAHTDLFVCLMGGFDPPEVALDHAKPMNFLMMIYPETRELSTFIKSVGSVDRPG